jgi:outer membrane protein assembly factor BamB
MLSTLIRVVKLSPIRLAFTAPLLALALAACGDTGTPAVEPVSPDSTVHSIRVVPANRMIGVLGTRIVVGALALLADGDTAYNASLDPGRFSWSSSAPEVARIDQDRIVVGLSEGTATITATSGGVSGSTTVTVADRARLAWSVHLGTGWVDAGVTIGPDGTIYVGANENPGDGSRWYALSSQGAVLWTLDLPRTNNAAPAIAADGTLYFGAAAAGVGSLYAVHPGGSIRWVLGDLQRIRTSPALAADGTIYVAGGSRVYAVDPGGHIRWSREIDEGNFHISSPAVAADGSIYLGSADGILYSFTAGGSLRWTYATGDVIHSSPAIGGDGTVYVASIGSGEGRLHAVDADGRRRWSLVMPVRLVSSSPSIGPDGTIYIVAHGVTAVDPSGSIRWNSAEGCGTDAATPVLGADGGIYMSGCLQGFAGSGAAIYALDAQGKLRWDYRAGGLSLGSVAIGVDGRIIAATHTSEHEVTVHAVEEVESANGGFDGAPWPQARGNRSNNGRGGG